MKIVALGLNHKTAPVGIRERMAFGEAESTKALSLLKDKFPEAEFVLLSTCNRVELYSASKQLGGVSAEELIKFLANFHNANVEEFEKFLYIYNDKEAVRHLLKVASSLDSMVVGEVQIISQVKESYKIACAAKSTGKILNRLFHCAFGTSKKIHTTTAVANGRVSVAGVAVELAMELFDDVKSAKVVVVGAGEMGQLLVQHLLHVGCEDITIVNRSLQRGKDIAQQYGISTGNWEGLEEQIIDADIVITSAATKGYLFKKDSLEQIWGGRNKKELLIIDIAVPRNFEPAVAEIESVYLYSIDDLEQVVERNRKVRENDVVKGMGIINKDVIEFMNWFRARDIGPMIGQMKEKLTQISQEELEQFFKTADEEIFYREQMEAMMNRILNKLLHCVIEDVNAVAKKQGPTEAAKLVESIMQRAEEKGVIGVRQ